ncbi:hypothetical protein ACFX1R_043765 [Malus domestica]
MAGIHFLAGSALGGAAANVCMLRIGRILLGYGVGFANQVATILCTLFCFMVTYYVTQVLGLEEAMAVGLAIAGEAGQYNGRMTPFVILSCMMAATGGVIFGYDIGISGGVTSMEPFLKKFFPEVNTKMKSDTKISNYCKFDSELLTSFTSSLYIAGLVASLFASLVTRAYGRKPSILAGGAAFLAGSALNGAAMNIYMLILGRVLLGVGVGFGNQAVPLYLSEMAPPK